MTSRERVLCALEHKPTDRVPMNFHGVPDVVNRLCTRLGLRDHDGLLKFLDVDFRRIEILYAVTDDVPDAEGYIRDTWGGRHRPDLPDRHPAKYLSPFNERTTVDDVYAHAWPSPDDVDYGNVAAQCARHAGDYITYGAPWSPFFHEVGWLIGQENLLVWMHTKPAVVSAIIDCMVSFEVGVTRRFLEACAGMLDITYFGNDFGTQRGLLFSPGQWQQFFRTPLKRFYDLSHDFGCRVMQHSCGSVRAIIPWLIEDGVDILDPVQVRAEGMSLPALMTEYGDRLAFHGGVDTQWTLPFGSLHDVRTEVRGYLAFARRHGGYILNGSQDYIADIPDEHILAIYEEGRRVD